MAIEEKKAIFNFQSACSAHLKFRLILSLGGTIITCFTNYNGAAAMLGCLRETLFSLFIAQNILKVRSLYYNK